MKEDINQFLENLWISIVDLLPRLISTVLVLILGYLLARIIQRLIRRFILYINDRLNQQLQISMLNVDLKSSANFISRTFFWIIITIVVLICTQILQLNFLTVWFDKILSYFPNILAAVIIVFGGIIAGRLLGDLIKSAAMQTGIVNGKYLGRMVRYLILFVAIVIAVGQLGIDIDFLTNMFLIVLATLLFGATLAFGLGAKTSIGNILGSYYIRKTHQVGTKVKLDDIEGTIVKITDHSVSIETKSGVTIIPAKDFNDSRVTIIREDHE